MTARDAAPDIETLRREGWDTPAAEYWKERAEEFRIQRDAARRAVAAIWSAQDDWCSEYEGVIAESLKSVSGGAGRATEKAKDADSGTETGTASSEC